MIAIPPNQTPTSPAGTTSVRRRTANLETPTATQGRVTTPTAATVTARCTASKTPSRPKKDHFRDEFELVERVQAARREGVDFILINPAAFTHTSVALRDALAAVAIPFIEIHLSNTHAREDFRQRSYFSDLAQGVICGLGAQGYELGLQAALSQLEQP